MRHRLSRPVPQMNMVGLTSPKVSHRASAVVTGAGSGIGARLTGSPTRAVKPSLSAATCRGSTIHGRPVLDRKRRRPGIRGAGQEGAHPDTGRKIPDTSTPKSNATPMPNWHWWSA